MGAQRLNTAEIIATHGAPKGKRVAVRELVTEA